MALLRVLIILSNSNVKQRNFILLNCNQSQREVNVRENPANVEINLFVKILIATFDIISVRDLNTAERMLKQNYRLHLMQSKEREKAQYSRKQYGVRD